MNILLALDCSLGMEDLVGEVLQQPWPKQTRFTLLHVVENAAKTDSSEECLRAAAFAFGERGFDTTRHMVEGIPKSAILDYAEAHPPDLILLGARRRYAVTRFLLGSVSTSVLRHASCSVQIVRPKPHDFRAERPYRVMLATDGSPQACKAAEAMASRPWKSGTEARVVSVIELILPPTISLVVPGDPDFPTHPDDYAEAKKKAHLATRQAAQIIHPVCLYVTEAVPVVATGAKGAIIEEAERWDADCIFVGSHGIHGLDRFLLGSVSEAVAIHAPCSVEVVR